MAAVSRQLIPWESFLPYHIARDLVDHPEVSPVGREQRFDAVVLAVDIWGFTAISEALATGGPGGAEELTDALNATFAPLIAIVESYGGIVGEFGGDSLTALFPFGEPDHALVARRAAACALAMQHYLARMAGVSTSAGTFTLAMRAGLAAGPVLATSVGDPAARLEHVLAGAVLGRAAAAERAARPGEVVVCVEMRPSLGQVVLADRRGSPDRRQGGGVWAGPERRSGIDRRAERDKGFLTIGALLNPPAPAPLPPLPPLPAAAEPIAAAFLAPTIARRLREGRSSFINEHRAVVVAFVALPGLGEADAPGAGARLQQALAQLFAIVERYEGYVNKISLGDRAGTALILFGAPLAHEDDAARALHCAAEIRALLPQTQVGVAGGLVFSGQVGSQARQEYTVIGDTVNVAARLMQQAAAGQIIAADPIRRAGGGAFEWQESRNMQLRGRAASIDAAVMAGLSRDERPAGEGAAPLIGRDDELAALRLHVELAVAGHGRVVGLAGEAGLGKSALAAAALAAAAHLGADTLSGECLSYRAASPYLAWRAPLRRLLGIAPGEDAEQARRRIAEHLDTIAPGLAARLPLLGPALGLSFPDSKMTLGMEAEQRKSALEDLLLTCIAHAARRRPLAIVLESCDWIDPLSYDLLDAVGRRCGGLPLLVILTYRSGLGLQPAPAQHIELRLAELGQQAAEALIAQVARGLAGPQASPSAALRRRIVERAGGNPFYIGEILSLMHGRGVDLAGGAEHDEVALPDSLNSLILSRIDQLAEGAQAALKVASVIGKEFNQRMLLAAHPPLAASDDLGARLEDLRRSDMAVLDRREPEPQYLFRHALTREVAYNSLSRATRAELHERIGGHMERAHAGDLERHVEVLAYHYGLSANQLKQREFFAMAGAAAQAAFANVAAIEWYERLLPLLHRHERPEVLLQLGRVLCLIGRWDAAEARYSEALGLAAGPREAALCRRLIGELNLRRGDLAAAAGWLDQSLSLCVAAGDRAGESAALHQLGMVAWSQGSYPVALARLQAALERAPRDDRAPMVQTLNNIGLVYWSLGDHGRALDCFERCLRLAAGLGNRQHIGVAIGNMGNVYMARGDYPRAMECYSQKLHYALDVGDRYETGICLGNVGHIYEAQGEYRRAIACHLRSLEIALDLGDQLGVGTAIHGLGVVAAAQDNIAEAAELFERAEALFSGIDAAQELCECRHAQADLAARRGEVVHARRLMAEALALAEASGHRELVRTCVMRSLELDCALGRVGRAAAVAELSAQLAAQRADDERAALHYAIVQIDPTRADDRTAAARLYRALHARTPSAEYRRRYSALMGVALPPPPPLPPPPAIVSEHQPTREELLERVEELLAIGPGKAGRQ